MGIYTTKRTDEEGNPFWESTDGSTHKTRKAAWSHSKSLELPSETETKSKSETDDKITSNYVQWESKLDKHAAQAPKQTALPPDSGPKTISCRL